MSKNGIKIFRSSKSINSFRKKSSTENFNNQIINFTNKYASSSSSSSSNNVAETIGDISICLTSGSNFKTLTRSKKNKKRKSRDTFKFMKNKERIKIPTGKRLSNGNNSSKLNLNNINNSYG